MLGGWGGGCLHHGNFVLNSVAGMVTRCSAAPLGSSRSNLPPMLGGPSCPPRNMTDRSATDPPVTVLPRVRCHRPDCSLVGVPITKRISTVKVDDPSPNLASASRRSPFRVPRNWASVNKERFSRPLRSSTRGFGGVGAGPHGHGY